MADVKLRPYKAIVWTIDPEQPGQRREVYAFDLDEARALVEIEFGRDCTVTLWNEEDASKPR